LKKKTRSQQPPDAAQQQKERYLKITQISHTYYYNYYYYYYKTIMWRKCCCFDLRTGCIVTGCVRLLSWVIVLTASVYTCLHVFSPDDKGLFHYRARINIEENGNFLN
jgi:hypothetical protein